MTVWHSHYFCQGRIPGHLASRDGSARDAGQMGSIPGRPGQSGTGGHPMLHCLQVSQSYLVTLQIRNTADVYSRMPNQVKFIFQHKHTHCKNEILKKIND